MQGGKGPYPPSTALTKDISGNSIKISISDSGAKFHELELIFTSENDYSNGCV